MSTEIDHVVFCVDHLAGAARWLESRHGLVSVEGGRHAGHGTANRIVPLGDAYMELVGVVDVGEAEASQFGRWVAARSGEGLYPDAVCLRTDDLDAVCRRLALEPVPMGRKKPDGMELRWRVAGLEAVFADGLPFFIEWDVDPGDHPARASLPQASPGSTVSVVMRGDPAILDRWAGAVPGLEVRDGEPGIEVVVGTPGGLELSLP